MIIIQNDDESILRITNIQCQDEDLRSIRYKRKNIMTTKNAGNLTDVIKTITLLTKILVDIPNVVGTDTTIITVVGVVEAYQKRKT